MRIVVSGVGPIPGSTLMERSEHLADHERSLLGFLLQEPRGHAAMCGAILTEPIHPACHAGVLFIEPLGPVHMCGHGAIAVAAMLVESGRVAGDGADVAVGLETPAGIVRCRVAIDDGRPVSTTIENVPAFSVGLDLSVRVAGVGDVRFDLAYGGHFYAIVAADSLGLVTRAIPGAAAHRGRRADPARRRGDDAARPSRHAGRARAPVRPVLRTRRRGRRRASGTPSSWLPAGARSVAVRNGHVRADGESPRPGTAGGRRVRSSTSPSSAACSPAGSPGSPRSARRPRSSPRSRAGRG